MSAPRWVLDSSSADRTRMGGKARSLAEMTAAGLPVPPWFVLVSEAADAPSAEVATELAEGLARICPDGAPVAVRSSALAEDGAQHSFAGQFESFLGVEKADLAARVEDVRRSAVSDRVAAYSRERGIDGVVRPPAVIVQRMVDAEAAGVAFGVDPVSGEDVCVVSAVRGLGDALVSGEADADTWRVSPDGRILARRLAGEAPVLADVQVAEVAALTASAGELGGGPRDVEWAIEGGRVWLLQSRPVTAVGASAEGELHIWDDSNIAESYRGVTTPLTFSFARRAYEEVYRQLCLILGVPPARVVDTAPTFRRMLGLVHGRIYYDLGSWYRVLATLPGFAVNHRFMEQMMGVSEGLPGDLLERIRAEARRGRFRDLLSLTGTVTGLITARATLPKRIERFEARLAEALAPRPLDSMRLDELAAYYRELEGKLLTRWDAPLVNDFFAMVFFGALGSACERWCGDRSGSLRNGLLRAAGGIVSAEPARLIGEMAALARRDASVVVALTSGTRETAESALSSVGGLAEAYDGYLDVYGDRCFEELKLESPTLHDDPLPLLRSIGALASRPDGGGAHGTDDAQALHAAEVAARSAIGPRPLRRLAFRWILGQARARVRDRENLRFERTRLFALVRRIFVHAGRRLVEAGVLRDERDVFYLEVEELLGFVEGTATTLRLQALAEARRAEFEAYGREPAPPGRFETHGAVGTAVIVPSVPISAGTSDAEALTGLGCCAGLVRGRVRVLRDPREGVLRAGEILVADRTDPGWVVVFPSAAAIVVEHGSLLSHAAIVARELGIPAVVSVAGATTLLADGELVEVDGATGVVRHLPAEAEAADA